ncbi:tryptophanyl-tRNA synthetase [Bacillus atrophaeus UCMB-5137]|nr:tryptophanyl-tRNA synthetase [Bacillus atrophaeus UCMB-5137]
MASWVLSSITPKGLMNRAHAYKAKVDKNKEEGLDVDAV